MMSDSLCGQVNVLARAVLSASLGLSQDRALEGSPTLAEASRIRHPEKSLIRVLLSSQLHGNISWVGSMPRSPVPASLHLLALRASLRTPPFTSPLSV